MKVQCPYCHQPCELAKDSSIVYSRDYGPIWICHPCQVWVGCHPGTTHPKGCPANATLRQLRIKAHGVFDPLWKLKAQRGMSIKEARFTGYMWLSKTLNIEFDRCHIAMMNEDDCKRVIELCQPHIKRTAQ